MRIRRTGRREIYSGHVFDLTVDRFHDEDENREFDIEIVHHNGGAAVLPVEEDGTLVLIRQWRYPLGHELIEIPAGRIDEGDDPESAAARELEEEAGLRAGRIESLGSMLPAPGYTTERIHLFLARDLTSVPQRLEEDERVEIVRMTLAEALAAVDSGEIDDGKTVVSLLRFARSK